MEKEEQALPTVDRRKKQGQAVMCSCGARIPVDKVYCPRCGKRRPRAWKCQKCGQLTTNEGVSCPVCGGKLSEIISTPTEKPKVNKKGGVFILLAAVLALAVRYVRIVLPFTWTYAVFNGIICFVNGIGEVRYPTVINILMLWAVRIPSAHLIAHFIDGQYIMACFPISFTFGMVSMFLYFLTGRWKNIKQLAAEQKRQQAA